MVRDPEVPRPGEEPTDGLLVLARLGTPGRAELPYGLQHSEPYAYLGVGDGEQRLIGQLLKEEQRILTEDLLRRLAREAAGEDGQRAQRRPGVVREQVPAPLHDRVQRAVALRHAPHPAAQQREPVAEAAGDVRHRERAHPRRGQLHGERQPVEVATQLGHRVRRQLHAGPGGPGPLGEQFDGGVETELRQRVHRLRCQAEGARLVASTRRSSEDETRACTRSAAPRTTCSQLSRTSSAGPEPSTPRMPDTGSWPFMAPGRPSPAPSAAATSAATSSSAVTPMSGTKTPRAARPGG